MLKRFHVLHPAAVSLACGLLCLLVGWASYSHFLARHLDSLAHGEAQRLEAQASSLENTLARYETLPQVLALDGPLLDLLQHPDDAVRLDAINRRLEEMQQRAEVSTLYLLDRGGKTLAAGNWQTPTSFVGQRYDFRPYFQQAIAGQPGRFYGVGATTGERGYFLSAPVLDRQGQPAGVVAIKVSLEAIEAAWKKGGEYLAMSDRNGVIFLATVPEWLFRTLAPLPATVEQALRSTRQYGTFALQPLPGPALPLAATKPVATRQQVGGAPLDLFMQSRASGSQGWRLLLFTDPAEARRAALGQAYAVGFACAFLLALAFYLRSRWLAAQERRAAQSALETAYGALEQRVAERTAELADKVGALERTERALRETQEGMVQAGKLALLGQLAAGITHEINQPLAALATLSGNAVKLIDRQRHDEARENLEQIVGLIQRLGNIVGQLKAFARKAPAELTPVEVKAAIDHATMIVEPRRRETAARIGLELPLLPLRVRADPVRLEQVLVNLMKNGLDAMAGQGGGTLALSVALAGEQVRIVVRDSGPGIPPEALPHLFEPFYTTKPLGEGLGLGLAISRAIVEGFGGRLEAGNDAGGGAQFVILLDRVAG